MPEDGFISMRDYTLQMKMLDYLHSVYPKVHITLHAGELAPGLVPPEGLRFHIRQAVELGHAERIGHGVDVMYEDNAQGLLKEMAQKHVMVEINLSSNEGILGIKGDEHPFPIYRAAHVPVALSTDDEGVSRIDITHEYVRAALDYHLSYADLKQLARTGMEHDFLPGASLWAAPDVFTTPAAACRGQVRRRQTILRPPARPFWMEARRPPRSGSWNAASVPSKPNSDRCGHPSTVADVCHGWGARLRRPLFVRNRGNGVPRLVKMRGHGLPRLAKSEAAKTADSSSIYPAATRLR